MRCRGSGFGLRALVGSGTRAQVVVGDGRCSLGSFSKPERDRSRNQSPPVPQRHAAQLIPLVPAANGNSLLSLCRDGFRPASSTGADRSTLEVSK